MKALVFLAAAASAVALIASTGSDSTTSANVELDRIIGRGEFNAVFPIAQADHDVQKKQYTARLLKIVDLLGSRDVSDMPAELRAERARNLQRLVEYRDQGVFPVNYDHPGAFLPCFIDKTGAICAAGYLVEQSAGRVVAEAINREYKYATISQMSSPTLDRWIASSGFSRAEIATIQGPSLSVDEMQIAGDTTTRARGYSPRGGRGRSARILISDSTSVQELPAVIESVPAVVVKPENQLTAPMAEPSVEATIGQSRSTRGDVRAIASRLPATR